jgi:hypothetical protein
MDQADGTCSYLVVFASLSKYSEQTSPHRGYPYVL